MVVFENGLAKKSAYRKFLVKSVSGSNDFAAMREVIYRRCKRLLEEDRDLPDLLIVDGGKGQLSAAAEALAELGLEHQPLAAIAKEEELIYVRGHEQHPVRLARTSPQLHLVQRIRDEAHRFAVTFHRQRRRRRTLHSTLEEIPGVGPQLRSRLLRALGSLQRVRHASAEELSRVVGPTLAARIWDVFHPPETARQQ
jgi:excinuclease ABC subunit C